MWAKRTLVALEQCATEISPWVLLSTSSHNRKLEEEMMIAITALPSSLSASRKTYFLRLILLLLISMYA